MWECKVLKANGEAIMKFYYPNEQEARSLLKIWASLEDAVWLNENCYVNKLGYKNCIEEINNVFS